MSFDGLETRADLERFVRDVVDQPSRQNVGLADQDGRIAALEAVPAVRTKRVLVTSLAAGTVDEYTLTWDDPFPTTGYTAVVSISSGTTTLLGLSVVRITAKTDSDITVLVANNAGGAMSGILNAIAVED